MHVKREISTSVSDLHVASVSDSIKRLAISKDGHPMKGFAMHNTDQVNGLYRNNQPIMTVMSSAKDDFLSKYEILGEIGKGGFSIVHKCMQRNTKHVYAVKIIDLRPLRLREKFNPARLRREVDIMKKLRHKNIIQFIEVYEDNNNLMMIMEYCPGKELFDVILENKSIPEQIAKGIFSQIARAVYYLHCLNILHRDIKPENILIMTEKDKNNQLVAKLLDFGLSKNANAGSLAKTFVGTPCYLAPEVEFTSKGLGGTYGLPADCWSLGAVLYVMLVARFPEFEQDPVTHKVVVKLNPDLWGNISEDAKTLIRSLMNTNPKARLTASGALQHPWLESYAATPDELSKVALSTYNLSHGLQEEEIIFSREQRRRNGSDVDDAVADFNAWGAAVDDSVQAVVVRPTRVLVPEDNALESLRIAPLLHLQRSIATCFEEAHSAYSEFPEVATQVRKGATLCRDQLTASMKMLRNVRETAGEVLNMFPDLVLAVEEEEPELAGNFFTTVKQWVSDLKESVRATQIANKASMDQIQDIVEKSTLGLNKSKKEKAITKFHMPKNFLDAVMAKLKIKKTSLLPMIGNEASSAVIANDDDGDNQEIEVNAEEMFELFLGLFGESPLLYANEKTNGLPSKSESPAKWMGPSTSFASAGSVHSLHTDDEVSGFNHQTSKDDVRSIYSLDSDTMDFDGNIEKARRNSIPENESSFMQHSGAQQYTLADIDVDRGTPEAVRHSNTRVSTPETLPDSTAKNAVSPDRLQMETIVENGNHPSPYQLTTIRPMVVAESAKPYTTASSASPKAAKKLAEALEKLRQVDSILEQLGVFWANTEIVLELLTKKGQHAEQFTGYARKPKLMARFRERIEEYRRFWENVELTCTNYLTGIQLPADDVSMQESDSDAYSVDSNETFSINSKGTTSAGNLPQPKNQEVPAMYAFLDKNKKPPARGQF